MSKADRTDGRTDLGVDLEPIGDAIAERARRRDQVAIGVTRLDRANQDGADDLGTVQDEPIARIVVLFERRFRFQHTRGRQHTTDVGGGFLLVATRRITLSLLGLELAPLLHRPTPTLLLNPSLRAQTGDVGIKSCGCQQASSIRPLRGRQSTIAAPHPPSSSAGRGSRVAPPGAGGLYG